MRVSKLELRGFKSFASLASLEFGQGVTAVVGPNGSGKSNLVDAIRLVLGGASARELRGQRLDQVIFSGGERRAPLGMAEVTVVFDNEDGRMPVEEVEVALSRRVFRDGTSEFRRNGQRIRLRDLGRLLDSTGLAQAGYAIIAQNDIESIIRATPTQRRHLIEEAAGVRSAQSLIDDSSARLVDLDRWLEGSVGRLTELMPRIADLEEQSRVAQEAADLKRRLESLRGSLERAAWLAAVAEATRLERQLDSARRRHEAAARQFADYDAHYGRERERLEAAQASRLERERLRGHTALRHQQAESELSRWRERAQQAAAARGAAVTQLEEVEFDLGALVAPLASGPLNTVALEQARAERQSVLDNLGELASRQGTIRQSRSLAEVEVQRIRRDLGDQDRAATELSGRLRGLEDRVAEMESASGTLHEEVRACQAELRAAEEQAQEAAARSASESADLKTSLRDESSALELLTAAEDEVKHLVDQERGEASEVSAHDAMLTERRRGRPIAEAAARGDLDLHPLAAAIHPLEPADARPIEVALGVLRQALVGSEAVARAALERGGGVVELVCWAVEGSSVGLQVPAGCRPLDMVVQGADDDLAVIRNLREDVCLADDRDAAARWLDLRPHGLAVLPDGTALARGMEATAPAQLGELEEFQQSARAKESLARTRSRLAERQRHLAWAREQHLLQRRRVDESRRTSAAAQAAASAAHDLAVRLRERSHELEARAAKTKLDLERARAQMASWQTELQSLGIRHQALVTELGGAEGALAAADAALGDMVEPEAAARLRLESIQMKLAELEAQERELVQRIRQEQEARARLVARRDSTKARIAAAEDDLVLALCMVAEMQSRKLAADAEMRLLSESGAAHAGDEDPLRQLGVLERRRAELELVLGQAASTTRSLERDLNDQREAVARARDRLGEQPMTDLDGTVPEDPGRAAVEITKLERRLQALGPLNELAPTQLADLLERTEGLRSAHQDTSAARQDLEVVMENLRSLVDTKLRGTMARVQTEFEATWKELFGGGRATMLKVAGDEPGAWGVELEVQPQGKRVIPMAMLSGGERALTALAMILALQQVSPSPFYVFDEVDAALDEVNVANFARILSVRSEHSQFLVITHSLATMARATHLYGVTQDGRGASRVLSVRLSEDGRSVQDRDGAELVEATVGA